VDLKDIKGIIELMKKNSISEFELEKQDFKVKLRRGPTAAEISQYQTAHIEEATPLAYLPPHQGMVPQQVQAGPAQGAETAVPENKDDGLAEITSPMIGTFYRSSSPESASYVEVGSEVEPDTVVCIVEAMKVMNEIKAEAKGVITKVMLENAKPVEFGQPLFKIRPS
jgi:acetyl-CoA carboxylase biotin carboxyl carrier protein